MLLLFVICYSKTCSNVDVILRPGKCWLLSHWCRKGDLEECGLDCNAVVWCRTEDRMVWGCGGAPGLESCVVVQGAGNWLCQTFCAVCQRFKSITVFPINIYIGTT